MSRLLLETLPCGRNFIATSFSNSIANDQRAFRAGLVLSQERMARIFDVSAKTIERWESSANAPPSPPDRKLLGDLAAIVELGEIVNGADGFRQFLATPMANFSGATPLQLLMQRKPQDVLQLLAQDYDGLGS